MMTRRNLFQLATAAAVAPAVATARPPTPALAAPHPTATLTGILYLNLDDAGGTPVAEAGVSIEARVGPDGALAGTLTRIVRTPTAAVPFAVDAGEARRVLAALGLTLPSPARLAVD